MILRRSILPPPSIIVFAAIGGVVALVALAIALVRFLRRRNQKARQRRRSLRHSARFENVVPSHVPVDALPPHMQFGYPENSLFPQAPRDQDGGRGGGAAMLPQSSTQSSSQLQRPSTQLSQYQLPPMGFSYDNYRSGVPPVHIPAPPGSRNNNNYHPNPNPASAPSSRHKPTYPTTAPAAPIPRANTPNPLPPLTHTLSMSGSRSRSRSSTPTPPSRAKPAFSARGNNFTLAVIPATPLMLDARTPGEGGDASSSGSDYSQLSDPGDPRVALPSVRVASPPARVVSPPVWVRSAAARNASPATRPLPPAISLPTSSLTSGRTRFPSLHAHFTPRTEDAPPLGAHALVPAPAPLPALPPHRGATDRGGHPPLRSPTSTGTATHEHDTRGRNANSHGEHAGLSDPQRAYFPPHLTLSPLALLERDFQRRTNDGSPPQRGDGPHGPSAGAPGAEGAAARAGESTSATEDTTDTSTSHGEATNVAFVASSGASRTWAQRCAEDGRFRNKFEALVASEVSEGSVDGRRGTGGGGEFVCCLFLVCVFVLFWGVGLGDVWCVFCWLFVRWGGLRMLPRGDLLYSLV